MKPFVPSRQHSKTKRVTTVVDDDSFAVWYRPSKVTPAAFDDLSDDESDEKVVKKLVDMVVDFVADWEIAEPVMNGHVDEAGNQMQAVGPDGEPVWQKWPVDRSHAAQLSFGVLNAIVKAIGDDLKPGETNAGV